MEALYPLLYGNCGECWRVIL